MMVLSLLSLIYVFTPLVHVYYHHKNTHSIAKEDFSLDLLFLLQWRLIYDGAFFVKSYLCIYTIGSCLLPP